MIVPTVDDQFLDDIHRPVDGIPVTTDTGERSRKKERRINRVPLGTPTGL